MRFICDIMLGKLSKYLRLLGFDTIYARSQEAIRQSLELERDRILLTRRSRAVHSSSTFSLASELPRQQLRELKDLIGPCLSTSTLLKRCAECNAILAEADKTEIEDLVPEYVYHHHTLFMQCPLCNKVYWAGSHRSNITAMLKEVINN